MGSASMKDITRVTSSSASAIMAVGDSVEGSIGIVEGAIPSVVEAVDAQCERLVELWSAQSNALDAHVHDLMSSLLQKAKDVASAQACVDRSANELGQTNDTIQAMCGHLDRVAERITAACRAIAGGTCNGAVGRVPPVADVGDGVSESEARHAESLQTDGFWTVEESIGNRLAQERSNCVQDIEKVVADMEERIVAAAKEQNQLVVAQGVERVNGAEEAHGRLAQSITDAVAQHQLECQEYQATIAALRVRISKLEVGINTATTRASGYEKQCIDLSTSFTERVRSGVSAKTTELTDKLWHAEGRIKDLEKQVAVASKLDAWRCDVEGQWQEKHTRMLQCLDKIGESWTVNEARIEEFACQLEHLNQAQVERAAGALRSVTERVFGVNLEHGGMQSFTEQVGREVTSHLQRLSGEVENVVQGLDAKLGVWKKQHQSAATDIVKESVAQAAKMLEARAQRVFEVQTEHRQVDEAVRAQAQAMASHFQKLHAELHVRERALVEAANRIKATVQMRERTMSERIVVERQQAAESLRLQMQAFSVGLARQQKLRHKAELEDVEKAAKDAYASQLLYWKEQSEQDQSEKESVRSECIHYRKRSALLERVTLAQRVRLRELQELIDTLSSEAFVSCTNDLHELWLKERTTSLNAVVDKLQQESIVQRHEIEGMQQDRIIAQHEDVVQEKKKVLERIRELSRAELEKRKEEHHVFMRDLYAEIKTHLSGMGVAPSGRKAVTIRARDVRAASSGNGDSAGTERVERGHSTRVHSSVDNTVSSVAHGIIKECGEAVAKMMDEASRISSKFEDIAETNAWQHDQRCKQLEALLVQVEDRGTVLMNNVETVAREYQEASTKRFGEWVDVTTTKLFAGARAQDDRFEKFTKVKIDDLNRRLNEVCDRATQMWDRKLLHVTQMSGNMIGDWMKVVEAHQTKALQDVAQQQRSEIARAASHAMIGVERVEEVLVEWAKEHFGRCAR